MPEPEDEGRFDFYPMPQPPNYNEEDVSDKPASVRDRTEVTPEEALNIERRFRCTLESVYGVDRGIGRLMDTLKQRRELDDTVIVFTSDNGFFYGEHRIPKGKPSPYEENLHMPLTIYVPPKFRDRAELAAGDERADREHRHRARPSSTSPTPSPAGPSGSAASWTAAR